MTIDLEGMRAAAEKATPGPWLHVEGERLSHDAHGWEEWAVKPALLRLPQDADDEEYHIVEDPFEAKTADLAFIATANPAAVLALLDYVERLKAREFALWQAVVKGLSEIKGATSSFCDCDGDFVAGQVNIRVDEMRHDLETIQARFQETNNDR